MPSIEDTALIISSEMSSKSSKLLSYFKTGGNVICSIKDPTLMKAVRGICFHSEEKFDKFWIKQSSSWISPKAGLTKDLLKSQFSQFCHVNEEVPKLTHGVIWGQKLTEPTIQQSRLLLDFQESTKEPSDTYLPIHFNTADCQFNFQDYETHLKTKTLGRTVIHTEVINTTFDILEGPLVHDGLVVIADQQVKGRGRGQNSWLSPKGCAMTSFQLKFNLSSKQGQKASLLQHLVSLAVVTSINSIPLSLKWPNDIYYSKIKMGGVVVLSSVIGNVMIFNIGLGFNLDNTKPTLSLNNLLINDGHAPLSREVFFANVFNTLEKYLTLLDTEEGLKHVLELYHQYWLHQDQIVTVIDENQEKVEGTVKSIDEFGYIVVELENGAKVSVQPGTNSFDMMQGLILPKCMNK